MSESLENGAFAEKVRFARLFCMRVSSVLTDDFVHCAARRAAYAGPPPECPDSDSVAIGMRFRRMTAKRGFRGRATEGRPKCSATWDTEPSKSLYSFGCRVRCGENRYDVSFGRVADLLHPPPFSLSGSPFVRGAAERGRTSEGRSCIRPPVIPFGRTRPVRGEACAAAGSCGLAPGRIAIVPTSNS